MRRVMLPVLVLWAVLSLPAVAEDLPDEVMIDGIEFVRVPAGAFWHVVETDNIGRRRPGMAAYREIRAHLDEYYIGKYEVRARDYVRFLNSKAAPQDWIGDPQYWLPIKDGCTIAYEPGIGFRERFPGTELPATAVSWAIARAFARWMGFRLPTEAEWVKAARGTDKRRWPWGDGYPDETYANYMVSAHCDPMPVNAYPKGRSPFGVYNMAGNVAEWTANPYDPASDQALRDGVRNPPVPARPAVFDESPLPSWIEKGGRWGNLAGYLAVASRFVNPPIDMNSSSGVRFAVDAETVRARLAEGRASVLLQRRKNR